MLGNADLLLCYLLERVNSSTPPVYLPLNSKRKGTENSLIQHRHVSSQQMFGLRKQADSVQNEELESDSIADM